MLRGNKEICDILLKSISAGIIILNYDQCIVDLNEKAEVLFGYEKGELLEKELTSLMPTEFNEQYTAYVHAVINNKKDRAIGGTTDIYGQNKNGDRIALELNLKPFKIKNEKYLLALIEDVSEKLEIEQNLRLKSSALESAGNGVIITDALQEDNPIIYFNSAFQKLTGYSGDEILGNNCRFLQGIDTNQPAIKELRSAIKNGESCQVTVRNYKKDGTFFWNDLYIIPIINENHVVTNFIGIQNDVSKRRQAESERNHFAKIFHESLNEIYVFDAETLKFLNVNHGAQKNIGYSSKELLKMTPLDLKTELDEHEYRQRIALLKNDKIEKIEFETVHRRKDGTTYPVDVHLQRSSLGDKAVFIAIILDITERKNYTEELENKVEERTAQLKLALSKEKELNELKTKFLSLVSHEFKTPLSGILTSTVLLSKYQATEEQFKRDKHTKIITEKVHYLNTILNDFLSLEKLEKGMVSYNFNHFKLSKILDDVIYNANMLLKEGQHIDYPDEIDDITLFQDEKIIGLILTNLVSNAIKYSSEHTVVSITVEQTKDFITIKVKDQGIGIPEKDQKSVFDRYFRAENVINIQGTGIGLNIVKNHLENLGGTISFESTEHKGATFSIGIPNNLETYNVKQ